MRDFHTLKIWEKSHQLVLEIYRATQTFPSSEMYGLTSQMRRAGSSIPANIAEGCGRDTNPELAHFCQVAAGSASELEYHLLLAHDLKLLDDSTYTTLNQQVNEVKRMLNAFIQKLRLKSKT
ncbi:MAG: four helix bundle protein [Anaerolineae bacterium]|nr:four helix bundle protein [Anaerolineae bacterium]